MKIQLRKLEIIDYYCYYYYSQGTLTCNVMNFKCLYVNGVSYGVIEDTENKTNNLNKDLEKLIGSETKEHKPI